MARGMDFSPVDHPLQGLARVANAAVGAYRSNQIDDEERANAEYSTGLLNDAVAAMFGQGGASGAPAGPVAAPSASAVEVEPLAPLGSQYRDAIAGIESAGSGDYAAVGPTHPELGRALGRYQIMEANLAPWSQEALGRAVTADEFLANPEIQDQIFDHRFGQYVQQYGPEGAAQAWFAGPGGVGALDRRDSLGTTVADYTDRFNAALGDGAAAPDPVQRVAAAMPTAEQTAEQTAPAQAPGIAPALLTAMTDPRVSPEVRQIAGILFQQQMQQSDPMRRLQMEYTQERLNQLRNPTLSPADQLARKRFEWEQAQANRTPEIVEYEYAVQQGYDGSFADYQREKRRAGAASTNVTIGEGDKFYEELDKQNAQLFGTLQQDGVNAAQNLVRLDRLEELLANTPQGALASWQQLAGQYGIDTEGLDNIQAAQALISQMVPAQRPAGSGQMSDADLELFMQSLPRIINQPGGNQLILDTMRGITQYTVAQGEIADRVANREITPAEGRRMLRELPNPLAGLGEREGGDLPEGVTEDDIRFTMEKHGLSREEVLRRISGGS